MDMNLSKLQEIVEDRDAWHTAVREDAKIGHDLDTEQQKSDLVTSAILVSFLAAQWSRIACQCKRCGFDPWVREIPGRRKWQPAPVFLLEIPWTEESGGQQSMGSHRIAHNLATEHAGRRYR